MEITTTLLQLTEKLALCAASVRNEEKLVSVYASALAGEGARYVDLAQERALSLARQLFEQDLEALQPPEAVPAHMDTSVIDTAQPPTTSPAEMEPAWLPTPLTAGEAVPVSPSDARESQLLTTPAVDEPSPSSAVPPEPPPVSEGPTPVIPW